MKSAVTSLHAVFPQTPISGWVGARSIVRVQQRRANGQQKRPKAVEHPFLSQRKLWCLLTVHFDGVDLRFAMPRELDHLVEVLSQNPMPSGRSLVPEHAIGRPNNHWLSRLPAKAKSWKYRQRLCTFLSTCPEAETFREFYSQNPIQFEFPDHYEPFFDAQQARYSLNRI